MVVALAAGPAFLGACSTTQTVKALSSSCSVALFGLPTVPGHSLPHDGPCASAFRRGGLSRSSRSGRGCTAAQASRYLEFTVTKSRLRKRRRRNDDGSGSDDDGTGGWSGGFGGGGNWNGGHGDWSGYSGGEWFFNRTAYELGWLWHVVVLMSICQTLGYFCLSGDVRRAQSPLRSSIGQPGAVLA